MDFLFIYAFHDLHIIIYRLSVCVSIPNGLVEVGKIQKRKPEAWFLPLNIRNHTEKLQVRAFWHSCCNMGRAANWTSQHLVSIILYVHHLNKSRLGRFLLSSVACPVLWVSTEKTLPHTWRPRDSTTTIRREMAINRRGSKQAAPACGFNVVA